VSTRWVVTHDLAEWKDEIAWMSLYFSLAVWASLALCVVYSLEIICRSTMDEAGDRQRIAGCGSRFESR
jgi:hypothetical protein